MTYSDFYNIAEYGNENWKGCFSPKEIAENAYDYLCEFNTSKQNGEPTETIKELAKLLAEDGGEECHDWLYEMTKSLGLFDMNAVDYTETDERLVQRFLEEKFFPVIFEIKTSNEYQPFFMYASSKSSIETQIHNALAEICFCDSYEITWHKTADDGYVNERELACREFEELFNEKIEDAFPSGKYTALSSIRKDIEWRLSQTSPKM